jgi:hypothetical protein
MSPSRPHNTVRLTGEFNSPAADEAWSDALAEADRSA